MKIQNVADASFRKYGRIIRGIDFSSLTEALKSTPLPEGTIYEPSVAELEALPIYQELQTKTYGELPIQIGYCNGNNYKMNALEYHRSSEVNVAPMDFILILGLEADVTDDYTYETSKAEAFLVPAGVAVEVFATSLHYAPCNAQDGGFQVAVVLPRDTNLPLDAAHEGGEDGHLTAKNKWLIGHPEGGLAEGSPMGLIGENIDIRK